MTAIIRPSSRRTSRGSHIHVRPTQRARRLRWKLHRDGKQQDTDGSGVGDRAFDAHSRGRDALEQNHTEGAMVSLMTSLAEKWGRNSTAAQAMVVSDIAYSAPDATSSTSPKGTRPPYRVRSRSWVWVPTTRSSKKAPTTSSLAPSATPTSAGYSSSLGLSRWCSTSITPPSSCR